ncbi:MAG: hypothetical protein DWQ10_18600 [Calditrichaeota bacterium]|nr:MAG: hypothetical protein DWQ10_18600 [Calditrichota bacterium]
MKKMKMRRIALFLPFLLVSSSLLMGQEEIIRKRHNYEFTPGENLELELEIDAAEVTLSPNPHESELSVYLEFSETAFDYDIDFDEHNHNISVNFEKKHWMNDDDGEYKTEIEVLLPRTVLLDLDCRIKAGEIDMELGDLSLKRFALRTWAGEVMISFDQANRVSMRSLSLNTKVGETRLKKLGNARFRHAEINNGIGQLDVDFSGLVEEATADVDLDIGATDIFIPEEVGVKLSVHKFLFLSQVNIPHQLRKRGSYYVSDNYQDDEKSVLLKVKPGIGDLRISYH